MKSERKHAVIVGAGVIGLTTAIELSQTHRVTIIADLFGPDTNSRLATAVWHVFLIKGEEEILASDPHLFWAERTLVKLVDIAETHPEAGVEMVPGFELFRRPEPAEFPAWMKVAQRYLQLKFLNREGLAKFNALDDNFVTEEERQKLMANPVTWGYSLNAPAAKMTTYLNWLLAENKKRGVTFLNQEITSFKSIEKDADILINCTGLGARKLLGDKDFTPYKGQYFVVSGGKGMPKFYIGDDHHPAGMAYAIPRAGEVLVGGTAEPNVATTEATVSWAEVYQRAALYFPWLRENADEFTVSSPVVGIRPVRSSGARLEVDKTLCRVPVIHNYGHGGSGFSLSWGCAERIAELVEECFSCA